MKFKTQTLVAVGAAVLSGCTTAQTTTPAVTSVNPIAVSAAQLSVGTANINGNKGMNVVATLRQTNGTSVLFNTPTLAGPFTFGPLLTPLAISSSSSNGASLAVSKNTNKGPSIAEAAAGTIGSTNPALTNPPNQAGGIVPASAATTFGVYAGIAATGFFQSNSTVNSVISTLCPDYCAPDTGTVSGPTTTSNTIVPFGQPFYANADANGSAAAFTPWLGAPAYAGPNGLGTRDGTFASGLNGAAMGLSVFNGVIPGAGTYTLNIAIPTGFNGNTPTSGTVSASATLANPGAYINGGAAIVAPTLTFTGNGGATGTFPLPGGATGAIIEIVDLGSDGAGGANCYPAQNPLIAGNFQPPAFYSVVTTGGAFTLPANLGPRQANATSATPTICTAAQNTAFLKTATPGDTVQVSVIAYDYNLPGLVPALSGGVQRPAVPAQADIALSATATQVSP